MLSSPRLATWRNKPKFQQLFLHLPPSQKRSSKIYCTRKRFSRAKKNFKTHSPDPRCAVLSYLLPFRRAFGDWPSPGKWASPEREGKKASTIDELQSERNRIRSRARRRNSCFRTIRHEKQWRKKKNSMKILVIHTTHGWHTFKRTRTHTHAIQKVGVRYAV